MSTRFEVNIDAVLESSARIGNIGKQLKLLNLGMNLAVKTAMADTFLEAIRQADENDGFPIEFQEHTLSVLDKFQGFNIVLENNLAFVGIDFDALGTQAELRRAFHQGARLETGGNLWGPWDGNEANLSTQDSQQAHIFWEAIRFSKQTAYNPETGKTMPTSKAPYSWDEIVNKYVEIWGPDKCPEWLFIQYGQEEWEPTIPQYDIEEEVGIKLNEIAETLLVDFVEGEVEAANLYESAGITVGVTNRGQLRLGGGQTLGLLGKLRKGGQYLPS